MNPVLEKLKKLLRLGRDGEASPAEAATALRKAQELAEASGIQLSQISTDDDSGPALSHKSIRGKGGTIHHLAAGIVKSHFGVEVILMKSVVGTEILIVGFPSNCELALYVYTYVSRAMRTAWTKRENRRLRDRESFLRGYSAAISQMMPETFRETGLVLSAKAYLEEVILGGRKANMKTAPGFSKTISDRALHEGFKAGRAGGIRNAIRGTGTPLIG